MYRSNKEYFEQAYRTGSDIWTHLPYQPLAFSMLPEMSQDSLVLDIGSGRGVWAMKLVQHGYRVLGIDFVKEVVDRCNRDLKEKNMSDRARFVVGDVLDIPFTDESFDAVTDIGVLQHFKPLDWAVYRDEVARVLKPGGYYLNVSLSRTTPRFLDFAPKLSEYGFFEKWGISYYFFKESEINELFSTAFEIVDTKIELFDAKSDPSDQLSLIFTLMRKR